MRAKLILFLLVFLTFGSMAFAMEVFKVRSVSVSVSEHEYAGICPHKFVFTGRITTNREGTVRYTWVRSDGIPQKTYILVFDTAGTKTVTHEWKLGEVGSDFEDCWAQIEILAPNSKTSNKAIFDLECIPKAKIYRISGRLFSYATQPVFLNALEGCQLKVRLAYGDRMTKEQVVNLDRSGNSEYFFVLTNASGYYRLTVEPEHLSERMLWKHTDPAFIVGELTEASPNAVNKNFTYYYGLSGLL